MEFRLQLFKKIEMSKHDDTIDIDALSKQLPVQRTELDRF